jgi:patatin-related protein
MAASSPTGEYTQEVRFAIVMYGGVSLAIYINGIAQEVLRLVRSTAQNGPVDLTGTERIYRKVSYLLADEKMSEADLDKASTSTGILPPTRFVVDILSGTSAGGINGIFLAKALANGQDMEELKQLWVTEGDIETLINDKRSIEKPLSLQNPPTSLLNSERMYLKLLDAFDGMDNAVPRREETDESPYVDELDLFVTSTDLQGVVLPIRLSDDFVFERRHRNVLHFVYSQPNMSGEQTRNDFFGAYNPFLAYAARCTSSFPFAFEPMCLKDTDTILTRHNRYKTNTDCNSSSNLWQRFYRDYLDPRGVSTIPFPKRAFGDGGYLDNKPFSYATETLMNRNADVPVDRKLIYIEPSPEHPEDDVEQEQKPDAIQNVMSALLTLPRYETIREDLERVKERNRLIDRVNAITNGVDRDEAIVKSEMQRQIPATEYDAWKQFGVLAPLPSGGAWAEDCPYDEQTGAFDLADMIKRKGRAYAAYHRLRISAVTDQLAKLIARVAGFDENSDYFIVIRSMVRAWRVMTYVEHRTTPEHAEMPTANRFLYEFDLSYPIRRINYLRIKADSLYRLDRDARALLRNLDKNSEIDFGQEEPFNEKQQEAYRNEILRFKKTLNNLFVMLRKSARSLRARHVTKDPGVAVKVSPVNEQVMDLIAAIEKAVQAVAVNRKSPSLILDYFLGKQNRTDSARSYKGESPEELCIRRCEAFLKSNDEIFQQFATTAAALKENVVEAKNDAERQSLDMFSQQNTQAVSNDREIEEVIWLARNALSHYYHNYENYDLLTYPIMYDTDVGEADTIDIIRISPEDAKQLIDERATGCHKLAGSALGHFGAFLQKEWRQNDILWGRLDGAERIISALLPNHPARVQLIGEAHAQIICETIEPMGEQERLMLLAESMMRTRTRKAEAEELDAFIGRLFTHSAGNPDLNRKLRQLIKPNELRQFYEDSFRTRSKVQPESALRSAARATTVIGKILGSLSQSRGVDKKYSVWIIRLGQIFWSLVEVAVPRSFPDLLFRHWLKLVYFLEALLIAGSTLLLAKEVQQFALTAFGITAAVHMAVLVLRDLIQSRNRWVNLAKAIGGVIVVTLIVVGGLTLAAVFDFKFAWNAIWTARHFIVTDHPWGFNWKSLARVLLIVLAFLVFAWSIRMDVKALFRRG